MGRLSLIFSAELECRVVERIQSYLVSPGLNVHVLKHIMEEFATSSSFTKKVSLLERRTILPVLWSLKQTVHG